MVGLALGRCVDLNAVQNRRRDPDALSAAAAAVGAVPLTLMTRMLRRRPVAFVAVVAGEDLRRSTTAV